MGILSTLNVGTSSILSWDAPESTTVSTTYRSSLKRDLKTSLEPWRISLLIHHSAAPSQLRSRGYPQQLEDIYRWELTEQNREDTFLMSDPFDIPEVYQAIGRCARALKSARNRSLTAGKVIPQLDRLIPLEIKCRIFDFLGAKDLQKALESGEWGMPDFYWRGHLHEVFLETDDLITGIDWQGLWLALEPLMETSREVLNRRRLLRIFHRICNEFIEVDGILAREDDNQSIILARWWAGRSSREQVELGWTKVRHMFRGRNRGKETALKRREL
jgi:hypothetical protein